MNVVSLINLVVYIYDTKTQLELIELWCSEPVAMVSTVIEHSACFSVHVGAIWLNCLLVVAPSTLFEEKWETADGSPGKDQS